MNAGVLWALGDKDLANIFAHLRRQPAARPVRRSHELTFRGRAALVTGEWKLAADQVDTRAPRWGEMPLSTPFEREIADLYVFLRAYHRLPPASG